MDELFRLSTIAVLSALLAGCTNFSPQEQPKQTAGTVLGAIGGGLLGAQVGSGAGQLAATAAGTLAGAWLGREVGASLDRANRLHAQQATYTALEHNPTGTASTWRNPDTGHYGAVTPTRQDSRTGLPGFRADGGDRRPGGNRPGHGLPRA